MCKKKVTSPAELTVYYNIYRTILLLNLFVSTILTWVVGSESEYDVTVVGHGYRVFERWQIEMPV